MRPVWSDDESVGDVLADLRRANVLPLSPAEARNWSFRLGKIVFTLPNFSWRRCAIDRHDLHHVLIDQPCNLRGECQVATWEFAAGAYPNIWSRLFCLPLVAAGFATAPRGTWRTFQTGCRQRSLYSLPVTNVMRLGELRAYIDNKVERRRPAVPRAVRFMFLVGAAFALVLTPVVFVLSLMS